jgi:hypothetical protein
MSEIVEGIMLKANGAELIEGYGWLDKFKKKHDIKAEKGAIGFSKKENKWYGWSHRAVAGFGIGDMIFDEDYGDDNTPFVKHGNKKIKNMQDARDAATAFARYIA